MASAKLMLSALAVILVVAWLFGLVDSHPFGAFVHLLLIIAVLLFVVDIISRGRTMVS
jgi:hypothetical protein